MLLTELSANTRPPIPPTPATQEINLLSMSPKEKEDAKNEIRVLAQLSHPNIIKLHDHLMVSPPMARCGTLGMGGFLGVGLAQNAALGDPDCARRGWPRYSLAQFWMSADLWAGGCSDWSGSMLGVQLRIGK